MANNNKYLAYPLVADARDLMQRAFDYMAAKFPGWLPSEGQLDTAIIEATSGEAADIASLTTEVPKSVFRYFGASIIGIPPVDAQAANCQTTWYAIDTNGYTIPSGTQVSLLDRESNTIPFVTLTDVVIPNGSDHTVTGEVVLVAIVPGVDANSVGNPGDDLINGLSDIFPWISSIIQETTTVNGLDAETDDAYLNRLAVELSTISPRPILPKDFSILAKTIPGVQRATTIDGYNPTGPSSDNERMVCVVALDSNGAGVGTGVKAQIAAYLDTLRELNFVINTDNPTTHSIDVTTTVLLNTHYSQTDVQARIQAAIAAYLSPAQWGVDSGDDPNNPTTWNNTPIISYLALARAIGNVPGVLMIESLTFGLHGGSLATTDVNMSGSAPLPTPGTVSVTVSLT